jgi:hypothetical protein
VGHDRVLRNLTYHGRGALPLTEGKSYDLRFLDSRLKVALSAYAVEVAELPYPDLESLDVSGSDRTNSAGATAAVILSLALGGAVLGLVLLGLLGFLLGAVIFGLLGALKAASSSKAETTQQLRGCETELIFRTTKMTPVAM